MASGLRTYLGLSGGLGIAGAALGAFGLGPLGLPLAFGTAAAPYLLGGLGVAGPGLWWLMKTIPPQPVLTRFPAIRILFNLSSEDKVAASAPLWQRLLRMGAVAAVITGLADPKFDADPALQDGNGPVVLVVDNDWSAKGDLIKTRLEGLLRAAERQGRPVVLIEAAPDTAEGVKAQSFPKAGEALKQVEHFETRPWSVDRAGVISALGPYQGAGASVVWISNGFEDTRIPDVIRSMQGAGSVSVVKGAPDAAAKMLSLEQSETLTLKAHRLHPGEEEKVFVSALNAAGDVLAQQEASFGKGDFSASVTFDIPAELRRQIVKMTIPGEIHAGAQVLLDEAKSRRSVGLLTAPGTPNLFEDSYYLKPALKPHADLVSGPDLTEILKQPISALVMADGAILAEEAEAQLAEWIKKGGLLLRFAGPRLAAQPGNSLTSMKLRAGADSTQGEFSGGGEASTLAPIHEDSPLAGLTIPADMKIKARVLPESGLGAEGAQIWAEFEDGAPFISARREGQGLSVLVHTAPDMNWSNMPLFGGFFMDMLKDVILQSKTAGLQADVKAPLPGLSVLNAEGRLELPSRGDIRLTREVQRGAVFGPTSPPGFYGENHFAKIAHNLYKAVPEYKPLEAHAPEGASLRQAPLEDTNGFEYWKGILVALGLAALLTDGYISTRQQNPAHSQTKRPAMKREEGGPQHG